MAEIKISYLEQLEQMAFKHLSDELVEQLRLYTIQLIED